MKSTNGRTLIILNLATKKLMPKKKKRPSRDAEADPGLRKQVRKEDRAPEEP